MIDLYRFTYTKCVHYCNSKVCSTKPHVIYCHLQHFIKVRVIHTYCVHACQVRGIIDIAVLAGPVPLHRPCQLQRGQHHTRWAHRMLPSVEAATLWRVSLWRVPHYGGCLSVGFATLCRVPYCGGSGENPLCNWHLLVIGSTLRSKLINHRYRVRLDR